MKRIIKYISAAVLGLGIIVSCTAKFEELNTSDITVNPSDLPFSAQCLEPLSYCYAPQQNMFQFWMNLSMDNYCGYFMTPNGNFTNGDFGENRSHSGGMHENYYLHIFNNTRRLISECEAEGKPAVAAVLRVVQALGTIMTTDTYGPIVYSAMFEESISGTNYPYDLQQDIYKAVFDDLDLAIEDLGKATDTEKADISAFDIWVYTKAGAGKGDIDKWIKTANTLRLRMALRLSKRVEEMTSAGYDLKAIAADAAKNTLAFTELLMLELKALREKRPESNAESLPTKHETELIRSLPFSLTEDQEKCLTEIRKDLDSRMPMSRLLQGDVGSGKTLVAWLSAVHMIDKGAQVAFMAPTELLARQHAEGAAELLSPLGIRIAFLTGSVRGEGRRLLLRSLKDGSIDLIVGTHALFSEDVEFRNLRYAIIDEQHRFGVQQRDALKAKGIEPNVLSMSATPIPRTLALTLFADLDVSTIRTMPAGRIPIKTYLVKEDSREKMFSAISVEFLRGHQAYFVYPRIDDEGESDLKDVTTMYEKLKEVFPGVPSALIHSMRPEEETMGILRSFREKKIAYLVATSVVEVGIDIPDATCMVIEHADRFGLAALHQLRGRVGRSSLPSYCFLVFGRNLSEDAKARLRVMRDTTDGFRIAEKDLEIRGPGEMTGDRQSGFLKLRFASITESPELVETARAEAERIIKEDRGLIKAENAVLRNAMR